MKKEDPNKLLIESYQDSYKTDRLRKTNPWKREGVIIREG